MDMQEFFLTIGGYTFSWLVDLAAVYILENTQKHFKDNLYLEYIGTRGSM